MQLGKNAGACNAPLQLGGRSVYFECVIQQVSVKEQVDCPEQRPATRLSLRRMIYLLQRKDTATILQDDSPALT